MVNMVGSGNTNPPSIALLAYGRHIHERPGTGVPDGMLGAGRHEHHRALADLALLITEQHLAAAADHDTYVLLGHVAVTGLLAARLAFHPPDAQVLRTELALGEQQV
jgi:hypothetical protein